MGLYFTLFYGAIVTIKNRLGESLTDQLAQLEKVCVANGWNCCENTVRDDVMTCVVDCRVSEAEIDVDYSTSFHTENHRLCIYDNGKERDIDNRTFELMRGELEPFVHDMRWIRRDFYSGDMSTTYVVEVCDEQK